MKRRLAISIFFAIYVLSFGKMDEPIELREFVYESHKLKALHILAYVREYSSISTYTDTVAMYREKLVDYMIPPRKKSRFNGWTIPRVLASRSYYRFTNAEGLDSVSDRYNHHFSWSDWIGLPRTVSLPESLRNADNALDTVMGKYSPAEIWSLTNDTVSVKVDALADTSAGKWAPTMSHFLNDISSFDQFRLAFRYNNKGEETLAPDALTDFSYIVESRGRGRNIYLFNRADEPYFVSTSAEVYILEKEYITLKEAKKWEKFKIKGDEIEIYEPAEAPMLSDEIQLLIDRVNNIDHDLARLSLTPDQRLVGRGIVKLNPGQQILKRLKGMFGIDKLIGKRKREKEWREFRNTRRKANQPDDP